MTEELPSAGDPIPPNCQRIEVHVAELKQLYDWWPIRQEARLYDRLSAMPVRIVYKDDTKADAWRSDWPVAPPTMKTPNDKPSAPVLG